MHRSRWLRIAAATAGLVALVGGIGFAVPERPEPTLADRGDRGDRKPEAPTSFDECGLVGVAAMRDVLGDEDIRVTLRSVKPAGDGWSTKCGYDNGRVGLAVNTVEVRTGVDPQTVEAPSSKGEPESFEISDLGDEAWGFVGPGLGKTSELRVRVRTGDRVLDLRYFAPVSEVGELAIPKPAIDLAQKALRRVPDDLNVKAIDSSGACKAVDRARIEQVLGGTLNAARTTTGPGDDVHCVFVGEQAALEASLWNRLRAKKFMAYFEANDTSGLAGGDEAAFSVHRTAAGTQAFAATIRVGERILAVSGAYTDGEAPERKGSEPTGQEQALVDHLAGSLLH